MTTTETPASQRDLQRFADELSEMKLLMRQMTENIQRITVMDERITVLQKSDDRGDRRLDSMAEDLRGLRMEYERDKARVHTTIWLVRALWAVAGGLLVWYQTGGAR